MSKNASDENLQSNTTTGERPNPSPVRPAESPSPPRFVPPTAGAVDMLKLLSDLEDQIENTARGPFGTLFRFDEDRFHMTVMKIRANLPEDLKRASRLAREMEVTSVEAKEQVERALADVKQGARAELERARAEAAQMREQAEKATTAQQLNSNKSAAELREAAARDAIRIQQDAEAEAERMIDDARRTGFSMLDTAHAQAEQAVAQSEILRKAEAKARELVETAELTSTAVRRGADDYARDVLANMEMALGKALGQIEQGRAVLDRR